MEPIQMFRLQLVDAEDDTVCRFAAGGKIEIDLVNACVEEIRHVNLATAPRVCDELDRALPTKWYHFGFVRKADALKATERILTDWHKDGGRPTDWAISRAISMVIHRLKQHMVEAFGVKASK